MLIAWSATALADHWVNVLTAALACLWVGVAVRMIAGRSDGGDTLTVLRRHVDAYPRLLACSQELTGVADPNVLAEVLCRHAAAISDGWRAVEVHIDQGDGPCCLARLGAVDVASADEIAYVVAEERSLVRRDDRSLRILLPLRAERRREQNGSPGRGVLAVLLQADERRDLLIGDLFEALARLGGIALASVDLLLRARDLAIHDQLTGLFGKEEFLRRMHEQIAQVRRSGGDLALIMCDLDHLKHYNDRYGHHAGDEALAGVAVAIRSAIDERATAARFGGEEFAILLTGRSAAAGDRIAEAIRSAVARMAVAGGEALTVSLGWGRYRHDGDDGDEGSDAFVARVDAALYRAKKSGRDRVEAAR